ncbi:hypothetical protein ACJJTC_009382 [Scirpophaga incertulas]
MDKNKHLVVGLHNAGSLGTRHDEFLLAMDELAMDIMAINETWLRYGEEGPSACYACVRRVSVVHKPDLGQHAIISVQFQFKVSKPSPQWICYRPFKNIIPDLFEVDLHSIDWGYVLRQGCLNDMMSARMHLHLATLLFGVVLSKKPSYLYDRLSWSRTMNKYNTRASSHLLIYSKHRTTAFRGSWSYSSTKCWNNIPPPLRDLKTVRTFRIRFKQYLLTQQKLN